MVFTLLEWDTALTVKSPEQMQIKLFADVFQSQRQLHL